MIRAGQIRVGIGGWIYEPWRKTFYPPDTPKTAELEYASRAVTAIEINGTFYRLQTPSVFAKWRDQTPEDFVFAIKAPRYIVQRRNLAENAESLEKFFSSGLSELGAKLGPILWQLAPTKKFDVEEITSFFELLPQRLGVLSLRHAIEVRHPTFATDAFLALARRLGICVVYTHADEYPEIADVTSSFVYARLRKAVSVEPTGYPKAEISAWKRRAELWANGSIPDDLPLTASVTKQASPRDVFVFFINGAKERAPAAARHMISLL